MSDIKATPLGKAISILLLLGVIAVGAYMVLRGPGSTGRVSPGDITLPSDPVEVSILVGGEKEQFLKDPGVQQVLAQHGITLRWTKVGSIEMVTTFNTAGQDGLWPSNQIAVELAASSNKQVVGSAENIFNSPIVFYAWGPVADALLKSGIVRQTSGGHFTVRSDALIDMAIGGKRWKEDLGLNIYGPIRIFSTDPTVSNSGNIWAGLLANIINGGVVTSESLPRVLPQVRAYFGSMGAMERSSGDIFENMLNQGMGSRPIIVGYENQLVEYVLEHQDQVQYIKDKIRILYPEPTIFASHPLIALTPKARRLAAVLRLPEVQKIAWQRHGFRTGLIGVQNDASVLTVGGIPETIDQVIPMPSARVMQAIIGALQRVEGQ